MMMRMALPDPRATLIVLPPHIRPVNITSSFMGEMGYNLSVVVHCIMAFTVPQNNHTVVIEETKTGMADQTGTLQLKPEDIAFLMSLLHNATTPLTTEQLIEALRAGSSR